MDEDKVLAAIEEMATQLGEIRGEMASQIDGLRGEMATQFDAVRGQFGEIRGEMATQLGEIRGEMASQIDGLRGEMATQFGEVRGRFGEMARSSDVTSLRLVMMERFERTEDKLNRLSDDLGVTMGAAMQNALVRANDREESREMTKLFYSMFALVRKLQTDVEELQKRVA